MTHLLHWYQALPWDLCCAILFGAMGTLALIVAWVYDRNMPNRKEQRLARQRDARRARRLKVYVMAPPNHTVGRDHYDFKRRVQGSNKL